jgi:hypothetical protein
LGRAVVDVLTGWQPDPFGEHELRLFSLEGRPTQHVSDGGRNSYEELPSVTRPMVTPPASRAGVSTRDLLRRRWKKLIPS